MSEYLPCYPFPPCFIRLGQVAVVSFHIFVGGMLELRRLCVNIFARRIIFMWEMSTDCVIFSFLQ